MEVEEAAEEVEAQEAAAGAEEVGAAAEEAEAPLVAPPRRHGTRGARRG